MASFHRIGTILDPNKTFTSSGNLPHHAQHIAVARLDTSSNKIIFLSVPCFDLNDHFIGAWTLAQEIPNPNKIIRDPYFRNKRDLEQAVHNAAKAKRKLRGIESVPEWFGYSDTPYAGQGMAFKKPEKVQGIVVFVDRDLSTGLRFEQLEYFIAETDHSLNDLKRQFCQWKIVKPREPGEGMRSFEDCLGRTTGKWRLELWVLPQGEGMELFRWEGKDNMIERWLDEDVWEESKVVYLEVHVCPLAQEVQEVQEVQEAENPIPEERLEHEEALEEPADNKVSTALPSPSPPNPEEDNAEENGEPEQEIQVSNSTEMRSKKTNEDVDEERTEADVGVEIDTAAKQQSKQQDESTDDEIVVARPNIVLKSQRKKPAPKQKQPKPRKGNREKDKVEEEGSEDEIEKIIGPNDEEQVVVYVSGKVVKRRRSQHW